jgi:alkylation response protein AidB-like acyl-CoA dehydrogenase
MEFSYSDEQRAIQELARQIIGDLSTAERLLELRRDPNAIDRELWKQLSEANLLGIALPEELGGTGFGILELCILLEEQGRTLAPLPLLPTLVYGALPISEFGSEEQRKRFLPGVASGDVILSAALGELGSSEPRRPRTVATPDDQGWKLEGEKISVPYAHLAERILVPAQTGGGAVGVFLLSPEVAGVELERQETTNHEPQFILRLRGARVPSEDVLGSPEGGEPILDWLIQRALVALCATQVGVTEAALHQTAEYTRTRKQFGRPIGSFQGVSMRAADAYIDIQAMRSTLWQAAWRLSEGMRADREVLAAKWWAAMGGHRVVHTVLHLHGGTGADVEYPIHRYFLWAKQIELTLGGGGRQLANLGALLAREGAES